MKQRRKRERRAEMRGAEAEEAEEAAEGVTGLEATAVESVAVGRPKDFGSSGLRRLSISLSCPSAATTARRRPRCAISQVGVDAGCARRAHVRPNRGDGPNGDLGGVWVASLAHRGGCDVNVVKTRAVVGRRAQRQRRAAEVESRVGELSA